VFTKAGMVTWDELTILAINISEAATENGQCRPCGAQKFSGGAAIHSWHKASDDSIGY